MGWQRHGRFAGGPTAARKTQRSAEEERPSGRARPPRDRLAPRRSEGLHHSLLSTSGCFEVPRFPRTTTRARPDAGSFCKTGLSPIQRDCANRMIGKLKGTIVAEDPPTLTLDVSGVGYEVATPVGTSGRATSQDGSVVLWVHTVLRSDALELFGFATELERRVFRQLIGVPNVGPRTALGVLSALPVLELLSAIEGSDLARLTRVPGIGKRTAERLVLELRGKLPVDPAPLGPSASPGTAPVEDAKTRLLSALTNMGYRPAEADRAVSALGPRVGEAPLSELLRAALAHLSP